MDSDDCMLYELSHREEAKYALISSNIYLNVWQEFTILTNRC